jgi:LPXTG-motif cell wall-anchored protein
MTEDKFEKAIEDFFAWSWQTEAIASFAIGTLMLIIGFVLLIRRKKIAGWILAGCGIFEIILVVLRLLIQYLSYVIGG